MRKMLAGCVSVLVICGGILSSDAMMPDVGRSSVQDQQQLVPISGSVDMPLVLVNDGRRLARGWRDLGGIFLESLSDDGTEGFERRLSSLENLHPMCQFVAWSLFSCVLSKISSPVDRLKLRERCGFFRNPSWLTSLVHASEVDEQYIDGRRFIASVWENMERAILGEVGESIRSQWPEYMEAYVKTLIKEEELKQEKFQTQIEKEKLEQANIKSQMQEQEFKQLKIGFDIDRMRAERDDHVEALQVEGIRRLQEVQKNQIAINREKIREQDERRKAIWREENSTLCEIGEFVQPFAQPFFQVAASKFGEKPASETK